MYRCHIPDVETGTHSLEVARIVYPNQGFVGINSLPDPEVEYQEGALIGSAFLTEVACRPKINLALV